MREGVCTASSRSVCGAVDMENIRKSLAASSLVGPIDVADFISQFRSVPSKPVVLSPALSLSTDTVPRDVLFDVPSFVQAFTFPDLHITGVTPFTVDVAAIPIQQDLLPFCVPETLGVVSLDTGTDVPFSSLCSIPVFLCVASALSPEVVGVEETVPVSVFGSSFPKLAKSFTYSPPSEFFCTTQSSDYLSSVPVGTVCIPSSSVQTPALAVPFSIVREIVMLPAGNGDLRVPASVLSAQVSAMGIGIRGDFLSIESRCVVSGADFVSPVQKKVGLLAPADVVSFPVFRCVVGVEDVSGCSTLQGFVQVDLFVPDSRVMGFVGVDDVAGVGHVVGLVVESVFCPVGVREGKVDGRIFSVPGVFTVYDLGCGVFPSRSGHLSAMGLPSGDDVVEHVTLGDFDVDKAPRLRLSELLDL